MKDNDDKTGQVVVAWETIMLNEQDPLYARGFKDGYEACEADSSALKARLTEYEKKICDLNALLGNVDGFNKDEHEDERDD